MPEHDDYDHDYSHDLYRYKWPESVEVEKHDTLRALHNAQDSWLITQKGIKWLPTTLCHPVTAFGNG